MNHEQALVLKERIEREQPGLWADVLDAYFGSVVVAVLPDRSLVWGGSKLSFFNFSEAWTFTCPESYDRQKLNIEVASCEYAAL